MIGTTKEMRKSFVKKFKKMLEEERMHLLSKSYDSLEVDTEGDDTDSIQGRILAHTAAQLMSRDKQKLLSIMAAIKRINDGNFGLCSECGEDISEKRLQINPCFHICISCAEEIEMNGRKLRK